MIKALATAPQAVSGFAKFSRKPITVVTVKYECGCLRQKYSAER